MAAISAQRTKFADAELERLQESERTSRAEIANLKKQLQQLATDFKYNLQLIKDRDTELEVLENQVNAHKTTETKLSEVRFKLMSWMHMHVLQSSCTQCM
jgi:predicted  nucleic acid-binding Zn-ribbon protein